MAKTSQPAAKPDYSAQINALRNQIAAAQSRIAQLEQEIRELNDRIQKLDVSKRTTEKRQRVWESTMDTERKRYIRAKKATVLRMGVGHHDKLNTMIAGSKGKNVYDSFCEICTVYTKQIEIAEEEIRVREREIERLQNDISSMYSQIAWYGG